MSEHKQVAGGGGVDDAQAALMFLRGVRVFVTTREKIKHPEGTDLFDAAIASLEAALSTQPLLSDQPAGVSNVDDAVRALRDIVQQCFVYERHRRMTDYCRPAFAKLRGLAEAALHPDQAKDGAAG